MIGEDPGGDRGARRGDGVEHPGGDRGAGNGDGGPFFPRYPGKDGF